VLVRSCIVLGSGRSGTSMVAGTLHTAGYYMGEDLLPATCANPKGFFEDRAINELNEDLLAGVSPVKPTSRRGRLYPRRLYYGDRWLATVELSADVRATPELRARMRSLVQSRPFCFKDPRFCYTLDAWRPVLEQPVFLCVFREPGVTAQSMITALRERDFLKDVRLSRRRALRVWSSMYAHVLERHRHSGDWLFVHYDQFLDGSAIPRVEALLETEIDSSFVDPQLKRSTGSRALPRRTAEVYRELCALAGHDGTEPTGPDVSSLGAGER
jgi:hypothetical protein